LGFDSLCSGDRTAVVINLLVGVVLLSWVMGVTLYSHFTATLALAECDQFRGSDVTEHQQKSDEISGDFERLAAEIAVAGSTALFLGAVYIGGLLGIATVAMICKLTHEKDLHETIAMCGLLMGCALVVLMARSILSWILSGLGDLFVFVIYRVSRLGTFLMNTGLTMAAFDIREVYR